MHHSPYDHVGVICRFLREGVSHPANIGACRFPREWDVAGVVWPASAPTRNSPIVVPVLDSDFRVRKRLRDTEAHDDANLTMLDSHEVSPQKEFEGGESDKFLKKAALPVNDTLHEPVVRTPEVTVNASKAVGHRARMSTTLNAQGMHCQSFLGPNNRQSWMVTSAQEKTPWVEGQMGRMEGNAWQGAKKNPIRIPTNLDKGYRTLLAATEADWGSGTIQAIMCRICPGTGFRTWERFKRHCDTAEAHPLTIAFCDHCGDFFARSDSLRRHRSKPPLRCRNAEPEKTEQKRWATERAHKEFKEELERCRKTGEVIGMHFARVIKEMFPESSKKHTGVKRRVDFWGPELDQWLEGPVRS